MNLAREQWKLIDRREVLVVASEGLAAAIRLRLEPEMHVCVLSPPPAREDDMSWLIETMFAYKPEGAGAQVGTECNLFAWNRFDAVVLQDSWKSGEQDAQKLQFAGRILALWDNNRGNFATKKVVLVADAAEFNTRVRAALQSNLPEAVEQVQRVLDRKRAVAMVEIFSRDFANAVYSAISGVPQETVSSGNVPAAPKLLESSELARAVEELTRQVIKAATEVIRKTILRSTSVFLVDDEEAAVSKAYMALTGVELKVMAEDPTTIKLVRVTDGWRASPTSFDELMTLCNQQVKDALAADASRDAVVVMDILFDVANCRNTGIDLIQHLRESATNRIGIVAFTGFTTPFVAMSAYLKGADYVVQKDGSVGAHDALRLRGTDRMIEALAILSFQRTYLRRVREHCKTLAKAPKEAVELANEARKLARLFERTMPQATVSLHLQQEWEDTHYILKLVQTITETNGEEIRRLLKDFGARY